MPKLPRVHTYKLPNLPLKYAYIIPRPRRTWHAIWVGYTPSDFLKSAAYREWLSGKYHG